MKQLTNKYGNPIQRYLCKCDCGNEVVFEAKKIGKKKNCGCSFMEGFDTLKDLTGKKFGKLTVIKVSDKRSPEGKRYFWDCICDCGKLITVSGGHLKSGHTSSCGCIRSYGEEKVAEILSKKSIKYIRQVKISEIKDIKPLPFDFGIYDENNNLIGLIEVQGKQHYDNNLLYASKALFLHD